MSDIHIERHHALGLPRAREIALQWVEQAENDYGMSCTYAEGIDGDTAEFKRPGVSGTVAVSADAFRVSIALGFLLDVFRVQIEEKVTRNLDEMLAGPSAAA